MNERSYQREAGGPVNLAKGGFWELEGGSEVANRETRRVQRPRLLSG